MKGQSLEKKTTVTLPSWEIEALDQAVKEGAGKNRSDLISRAVEVYLKRRKKKKLESLMMDGYRENAERDLAIYQDLEGALLDAPDY
ncbi:MAG: ribbon-helix-helix protein, CopG family [Nitrospirae bacterium]|nr:ribbon-helix-helix protein, CopG family [Nitrospirota bacterium]